MYMTEKKNKGGNSSSNKEARVNNTNEDIQGKPKYVTANPKTYKLIKEIRDELKRNPTKPETIIWEQLRNKKTGFKIRRQHIIGDYIVDFVCLKKKVVIEIDGKVHLSRKLYDEARSFKLNTHGFKVIRFENEEVLNNPILIAQKIKEYLEKV